MFLQSLGKYLHVQGRAGRTRRDVRLRRGPACCTTRAGWPTNEYPYLDKPEKLEFPTETWAAQDIRKSDVFTMRRSTRAANERETFLGARAVLPADSIRTLQRCRRDARAAGHRPAHVGAYAPWFDVARWIAPHRRRASDLARPGRVRAAASAGPEARHDRRGGGRSSRCCCGRRGGCAEYFMLYQRSQEFADRSPRSARIRRVERQIASRRGACARATRARPTTGIPRSACVMASRRPRRRRAEISSP